MQYLLKNLTNYFFDAIIVYDDKRKIISKNAFLGVFLGEFA
jgi:hypothetical protein